MISLKTNRLTLKLISEEDLSDIHKLHLDTSVSKYNVLRPPSDMEETIKTVTPWIAANAISEIQAYTFKIVDIKTDEFLGLFGLKLGNPLYKRAEVWYKYHQNYWGKGIATEVLTEVLRFCFDDLKLHRVEAGCAIDNIGSIKVLEKTGFIKEGTGRQVLPLVSGWSDNYEFAILETDYRKV
jgi:RimJ/RimL family protein N-acetyltransferase